MRLTRAGKLSSLDEVYAAPVVAIVLCALGAMGQTLLSSQPEDWKVQLRKLRSIDWRRINKEWQGIVMSGPDVVNRRQNRMDTASFLKLKMDLMLTPNEQRSLKGATDASVVIDDLRKLARQQPTSH